MAPRTRKARPARTASSQQQSTLSFHGKPNRVTKSSSTTQQISKKEAALFEDVANAEIQPEPSKPSTSEKAIQQQTEEEAETLETSAIEAPVEGPSRTEDVLGGRAVESEVGAVEGMSGAGWVGDEEQRAGKISDTQIKRYWRQKEEQRVAPRVHQQDLSVYEKVLREWDMSGQYGPCIGIARLKRWKRANVLGLDPPIEVLAVLLKDMDGGEPKAQRAFVDSLMSSRFAVEG